MDNQSDIAVIGMSCLLPGARDAAAYWSNILAKKCFIEDGSDEWINDTYAPEKWADGHRAHNPEGANRMYTKRVGLLKELAEFDPLEFGIVPNAVPATEPDHFLALKLAAHALRHSGYEEKPFDHESTGIILGRGATPNRGQANGLLNSWVLDQFMDTLGKLLPELDAATMERVANSFRASLLPLPPEVAPGLVSNVAVGRIANRLDLQGPSYLIDASCASTLIAVELAIKELRSGNSRMMLAGGVQASMPPQVYMLFCQLQALSRDRARPFDSRADGTILAEGVGFLVLKRLADAEADGDTIYAVLKSAGIASDGRAQGLLTPRLDGEILAVRRAYEQAGIDPDTVGLIEAHGTGIPLGDETEVRALRAVLDAKPGPPRRALGSVKSMIGHCIPAAGTASLVKTILALHYKILPPTLCDEVNPSLDLENSSLYVNTEARPWIQGTLEHPRRAGINAFGFGGINVHIVLEEYARPVAKQASGYTWPCELILMSASSPAELIGRTVELREKIAAEPGLTLANIARPLASETHQPCRLAIVATDTADLDAKLASAAEKIASGKRERLHTPKGIFFDLTEKPDPPGKVAFLFPGQGSQYEGMLADLCMAFPRVRDHFDRSDAAFAGIWDFPPSTYVFPPPTCLKPEIREKLRESFLTLDVAMETINTAAVAMFELLGDFGLHCDLMAGHSTGEYAALMASGAVDVPDVNEQVALKRRLRQYGRDHKTDEEAPRGSLLAVGAVDPSELNARIARLEGRVCVAMDNCPHQKILFGPPEDIDPLAEELKALGGVCQVLPFNTAYHTPLAAPLHQTMVAYYEQHPITAPRHRLISCATLHEFPSDPAAIRETAASQWSSPVRFRETITRLYDEEDVRFFVEVGPGSVLTAFVEDTLRKREALAVATNDRNRSGLEQFLRFLAQMWCRGFNPDFSPMFRSRDIGSPVAPGPARRPSPANKVLNVLLPEMTLADDMVREVRRKAGLGGSRNGSATPLTAAPAPSASPEQVHATANALATHEQLMQEFLNSQQRSIEALFDRIDR